MITSYKDYLEYLKADEEALGYSKKNKPRWGGQGGVYGSTRNYFASVNIILIVKRERFINLIHYF